tara:strand:+ start:211 stop:702 length:492 start_codon:yes stop_codon:yes gene_type:complete
MSGKVTDNLGRASGLSKAVAGGAGKILQVVTGTSATEVSVTGTSYTDSGLDVAITPSASSSLIYVLAATGVYQAGGYAGYLSLFRDSTNLAGDNSPDHMNSMWASTNGNNVITPFCISFLDSPSSTSSITYSLYAKAQTSGQATKVVASGPVSSIIAMEIDGS